MKTVKSVIGNENCSQKYDMKVGICCKNFQNHDREADFAWILESQSNQINSCQMKIISS